MSSQLLFIDTSFPHLRYCNIVRSSIYSCQPYDLTCVPHLRLITNFIASAEAQHRLDMSPLNRGRARDTPSTFDQIPDGLLRDILVRLTRKDLKRARLVNWRFSCITSHVIFRSVILRGAESSYIQLQNILASPFWAEQVRHVEWSPHGSSTQEVHDGRHCFDKQWRDLAQLPRIESLRLDYDDDASRNRFLDFMLMHGQFRRRSCLEIFRCTLPTAWRRVPEYSNFEVWNKRSWVTDSA